MILCVYVVLLLKVECFVKIVDKAELASLSIFKFEYVCVIKFPKRWCLITPVGFFGFCLYRIQVARRLGGGELGHGLGALRDGVLGELTGEDEADGSLDLARGKSGLLVDASEL